MLSYVALGLAVLVFVMAIARGRKVSALEDEIRMMKYLEGSVRELRKEVDGKLGYTRRHLAQVASGAKLPGDMILEGKPFADVSGAAAQKMLDDNPSFYVLDVRTHGEYSGGHIPASKLIPIDQLDGRTGELPGKDVPMLVTCAGGSRSAAACAMLAEKGWTTLYNMQTGMSGWRGKIETGAGQA